jgi:hypothetical protein
MVYYRAQARQVATLARITALENRLIIRNEQRAREARNTVIGLSEVVRKNYNMPHDMAVLQQAKEIERRTQLLINILHQLRQPWQVAGHRTELAQLPTQLNQYVAFIREFVPDAPLLNHASSRTETIDWLGEFNTAREPKPASLAQFTKLETQVYQLEAEAIESQASKVGSECICFDKIAAFAVPASETVAPGSLYKAQLTLIKAASSLRPTMSANAQALPVDPAGQGLVRLRIPMLRTNQPDTARAWWHGLVRLRGRTNDTVLKVTVPYFIVKSTRR